MDALKTYPAAAPRTSISAGIIVGALLADDEAVSQTVTKIFPVLVKDADLPYVAYRCLRMDSQPVKNGRGSETSFVEVLCVSEGYGEGVRLAESVRAALDRQKAAAPGMTMRDCLFIDREEAYDGAFIQRLIFQVKI